MLLKMQCHIERVDGENDEITYQYFQSYDEAYDLLANIYADALWAEADLEIIKIENVDN